jgi:ornithine cyclodeaminase
MVSTPTVIDEQTIRHSLAFGDEVIGVIARAFRELSDPSAHIQIPPIMQITVPGRDGLTCIKSSYNESDSIFAVKLASTYGGNRKEGLPIASGAMLVCSAVTGEVLSVLLDNGYLTALRTQAAGAVAVDLLANEDAHRVTVIGSGRQARLQLMAACHVRDIRHASVWSNDAEGATAFADDMASALAIPVEASGDPKQSALMSDILITATPSRAPIVHDDWLAPGVTVLSMGADAPGKSEIGSEVFPLLDRYVCDLASQCRQCSDLGNALRDGTIDGRYPVNELGDVLAGRAEGRTDRDQIVLADLTGVGVQDTAIAARAREKCETCV